jgi:fatty-acyl-CoA synthase
VPTVDASSDLSSLLHFLAASHPEIAAVADESGELGFADLDARATRWAGALRAAGFGEGAHVGLLAANSPEWLAVAFGVWRAGATLVPISTFVTATELEAILVHADISLLVLEPKLGNRDFSDGLAGVLAATRVCRVVDLSSPPSRVGDAAAEFLEQDGTPSLRADAANPDATACILYTSGTTGRPKGVVLSHRSILATVAPTAARSGLRPGDRMLSSLPFFWVAGLVIRALPTLFSGAGLVVSRTFSATGVVDLLRRYRPQGIHVRPPQVGAVLAAVDDPSGVFACIRRGNGRRDWFHGHLPPEARLVTGYGMTEMSGYVVALDYRAGDAERDEQMGEPLPGVEMRIVDAAGDEVPRGTPGAIQVRGPGMYLGYYREPPGTGRTADGWFDTGDIGSLESTGRFCFSGRSKDLLRVKGINVSPVEVEAVLTAHPGVEAAFVVGLPPEGLDQRVVALVVAAPGDAAPTVESLAGWAAERLSHYKRPEAYVWIERGEVPLGATSKPQRDALADIAAARLGDVLLSTGK